MGFNSAFKGLKLLKNPGNGRLNNLNDPVLNVLKEKQEDFYLILLRPFLPNTQELLDLLHGRSGHGFSCP